MAKVEEYQQMMAWLTRPKSKFQESRSMDQAALVDELVPGPLKDEMLGKFNPDQETYEEYLQRINLERPFNMAEGGQLVAPSVDGSRPGYGGEYPINISKEGNSFRVKLLNGKRKSVKDLDAAIELLKSDGQTVEYLGADQKQVLNWIKSQTEPITTDDIAKYISDNDLSVRRNKITNIIKDNPEYEGKVKLVIKKTDFLNKDGTIKQGTVDEITKMINNPEDFPTMQDIAKKLKYKGTIKNVIDQWAAQTGNTVPERRFRLHTYEGTAIQKNLVKAFEAQGDNPNIMKLAREFFPEMYKKKKTSATQQVRRILTEFANYVPRPNEPVPPGGEGYWKRRRKKINLALKRMGDTTIGEQMANQIWEENQKWVKLADENPNAILKNKKLRDALTITVDVDTGEIKKRNLTDDEILERVKRGDLFTEDHITEVKQVETAPKKGGGTKLIKGHAVEYPTNKQSVTTFWNQSFLPNARKYIAANPDGKNVKDIVKILDDYGLKLQVGGKSYGSTVEKVAWNSKTNLSPRLKSNFDVFDSSQDPKTLNKFLKQAGFKIDKCLSSGGRVKLQDGKGVNTCIKGVIEAEQKKAMKGNKASLKKFGKFGKLARTGAWILGPLDIPIELGFALPHMLAGDKEAAKRATTFGLFGWGKDKLDEVKADSPEAYKYAKHMKDNENYIDAYFSALDASENLDRLKDLPEHAQKEKKLIYNNQFDKAQEKMASIQEGYVGYGDEEGKDVWEEAKGKSATQDYFIKDVKEKADKGLDMKQYGGHGMNIALGLPWNFGMKSGDVAPFKGGQPITNLKQYIAQRGQPYWKQLEHATYEAGIPTLFDNYFATADVREPEDAYSDLPIKYAGELGKLEKEEMLRGLKEQGEFMTRGFKDSLEAQGIDWDEAMNVGKKDWKFDIFGKRHLRASGGRAGHMGGGIASIRRPNAIPPESGPTPQGLPSMYNRVKRI